MGIGKAPQRLATGWYFRAHCCAQQAAAQSPGYCLRWEWEWEWEARAVQWVVVVEPHATALLLAEKEAEPS